MSLNQFSKERRITRRAKLRPLNHRKKLGPKSCHANRKRKRGQG